MSTIGYPSSGQSVYAWLNETLIALLYQSLLALSGYTSDVTIWLWQATLAM